VSRSLISSNHFPDCLNRSSGFLEKVFDILPEISGMNLDARKRFKPFETDGQAF